MSIIRWIMSSLALVAMSASVDAQIVADDEGDPVVTGSVTYEGPELYWFDEELEFCPSACYTEVVQRTVIRCEAPAGPVDGQPSINDRGEFVGTVPRWRIREHHAIVEQSIREDDCDRSIRDTTIQDLESTPLYLPGDPDIEDTRTLRDLGLQPFDCNDHYPVTIENNRNPPTIAPYPIISTQLSFDLLIETLYFTCH